MDKFNKECDASKYEKAESWLEAFKLDPEEKASKNEMLKIVETFSDGSKRISYHAEEIDVVFQVLIDSEGNKKMIKGIIC